MRIQAPAKINLHLRVGPRSADGFHPLVSWMCTVALFDTLVLETVACSGPAGVRSIAFQCDDDRLPTDGKNLVVRAAESVIEGARFTSSDRGVSIALSKRIPTGGGLGGGSSDAAHTLLGINQQCDLQRSTERLREIAATLGSDVAFFLFGSSSVCSGRGEMVRPIAPPHPKACLLILPQMAVPTPEVYRRFDEMKLGSDLSAAAQTPWQQWSQLSASELLPQLANDLEAPAFDLHPELSRLRLSAEHALGRAVRMSGSGSSLFTLFDDLASAENAAAEIGRRLEVRSIASQLAPRIDDDLKRV